jgi:hypothetical protein
MVALHVLVATVVTMVIDRVPVTCSSDCSDCGDCGNSGEW